MGQTSAATQLLSLILLSGILYLEAVKLGLCSVDHNVGCLDFERKALLEVKQGLVDPSDGLSSWTGEDCCKWRGVGCNKKTGRVTRLNLRNEYVDGLDGEDGAMHAINEKIGSLIVGICSALY
ncbi:hypothetical protein EV1_023012 [Malus domestica]